MFGRPAVISLVRRQSTLDVSGKNIDSEIFSSVNRRIYVYFNGNFAAVYVLRDFAVFRVEWEFVPGCKMHRKYEFKYGLHDDGFGNCRLKQIVHSGAYAVVLKTPGIESRSK